MTPKVPLYSTQTRKELFVHLFPRYEVIEYGKQESRRSAYFALVINTVTLRETFKAVESITTFDVLRTLKAQNLEYTKM
jgi:hypothetical protein